MQKFDLVLKDNQPLKIDESLTIDRGFPNSPLEVERKIAR